MGAAVRVLLDPQRVAPCARLDVLTWFHQRVVVEVLKEGLDDFRREHSPAIRSVVPLGDEIQTTVGRLAAVPVSGHLLQVLDPAEADLPYTGRIRFRGLEREGDTLIPRVEGVRDEYGRRMKAQQEGLAAICAAAGFGFAIHRTDHSPEAALLGLYTALTAR